MKSLATLLLFALLLNGCAAATVKHSPANYIDGHGVEGISSERMGDNLNRGTNEMGYYFLEARLITDPYLETEQREIGKKQLLTDEQLAQKIRQQKSFYTLNKTCFSILLATNSIESAYFKYWDAKMVEPNNVLTPVVFENVTGPESVATPIQHSMNGYTWHNVSIACASKAFDRNSDLKVHFSTHFQSDAPVIDLVWLNIAPVAK